MDGRLTITEVAKTLGVTPRTIMRWEKSGKIKKSRRDWRGWRFYQREDLDDIKKFYESTYEYGEIERSIIGDAKNVIATIFIVSSLMSSFIVCGCLYADEGNVSENKGIVETPKSVDINLDKLPVEGTAEAPIQEVVKYTLGPDDVIAIEVRSHPEFSGTYAINSEGKIEYKYVGDILVTGLTKLELKDRLTKILSEYIITPDVNVQITAYLSKIFYVVGEVGRPGKFYMKGNTITVREALIQASLPTTAAAMRRCRLITPSATGKNNYIDVDVYTLLYEGNLEQDFVMKPGEVLYVPATAMAKVMRVISPITGAARETTSTATTATTTGALVGGL